MIRTGHETASTASVPAVASSDSRLAKFISDGQPPKTIGKLLNRVEGICSESESPQYIAVQHLPSVMSPDAIVLTDRRVIIFRSKALGRMNMVDVQWMDVSNIHVKEGVVGASLTVTGLNGHVETIDHLPKPQARSVYRVGQEREEQMREFRRSRKMEEDRNAASQVNVNTSVAAPVASAPDPMERLSKLKTMLDSGLIEQADFDARKAEILSEI
nr:PH domain-containing protein [Rubripirellula obstinata]